MKKGLVFILAVVMIASMMAGCAKSEMFSDSVSDESMKQYGGRGEEVSYSMDNSAPAPEMLLSKDTPVTEPADGGGYYEEGRKAIKTASVQMEVDSYQDTYDSIKTMLGGNGYIEESNIWKTPTHVNGEKYLLTNGFLRLRIKADVFEGFTEGLNVIGTVLNSSAVEDDISDMYYDTEARLELKRDEKERLEAYADDIDDPEVFFQTQRRITEVIYEIESLQGTLKKWDSKVEYSTVHITINEKHPEEDSALPAPKGFFEKVWDSLKSGVSFLGDVAIFFAGALPFLLILAAFVIVIIIIIRKATGKSKKKKTDRENKEK